MSRTSIVAVVLLASVIGCKPKTELHAADAAPPATTPSVPVPPEPPPPQAAKAGEVPELEANLATAAEQPGGR